MKRILWIVGAAALAVIALVALVVALLPRETLKTRLGEQIAAWTGRDVSLRGEPEISLFPQLTVTLTDVEVGGPRGMDDAEIIAMDRLIGTVRILPLIIGRVEIGSFTMVSPRVHLVSDVSGARNWEFDSGAAALQLAFAGDVPLGDFQLQNGTVIYENRTSGVTQRFDSVSIQVDWPSVRQPIEVAGSAAWNGETVEFSARAAAPFAFINGGASPVEAHLRSAPINIGFNGEAAELDAVRLSGDLNLETPSLRGFASWLGSPIGPGSTLGAASLAGSAIVQEGVLSVEDAQLALDGNSASGALAVTLAAEPEVTGTLALQRLDLTPYFAGLETGVGDGESWREARIETDWFRDLGADLRISAASVNLGGFGFGESAASLSIRDATLEIGIAKAELYGGSLSGDLTVSDGGKPREALWVAQLRAADFDLGRLAPQLGLPAGLAGTTTIATDMTSAGQEFGLILTSLGGTSTVQLRNGALPLFGLPELAAAGSGAAAAQGADASEVSPISLAAARLSFSGGAAILDRASSAAQNFTAAATGRIGLTDGSLNVSGTVQPAAPAAAPQPFVIEGTLGSPVTRSVALAN